MGEGDDGEGGVLDLVGLGGGCGCCSTLSLLYLWRNPFALADRGRKILAFHWSIVVAHGSTFPAYLMDTSRRLDVVVRWWLIGFVWFSGMFHFWLMLLHDWLIFHTHGSHGPLAGAMMLVDWLFINVPRVHLFLEMILVVRPHTTKEDLG